MKFTNNNNEKPIHPPKQTNYNNNKTCFLHVQNAAFDFESLDWGKTIEVSK